MAISMSKVKGSSRTVTVHWDDEEASVEYRRGAISPALINDVVESESAGKGHMAVVDLLADVVISWDLLDENGEQLPASEEVMLTLPLEFLSTVLQAVQEDMSPTGEAKTGSSFG